MGVVGGFQKGTFFFRLTEYQIVVTILRYCIFFPWLGYAYLSPYDEDNWLNLINPLYESSYISSSNKANSLEGHIYLLLFLELKKILIKI